MDAFHDTRTPSMAFKVSRQPQHFPTSSSFSSTRRPKHANQAPNNHRKHLLARLDRTHICHVSQAEGDRVDVERIVRKGQGLCISLHVRVDTSSAEVIRKAAVGHVGCVTAMSSYPCCALLCVTRRYHETRRIRVKEEEVARSENKSGPRKEKGTTGN